MANGNELEDRDETRRRNIRRLGSSPAPGFQSRGVQPSEIQPEDNRRFPRLGDIQVGDIPERGLRRLSPQAGPDVGGATGVAAGTGSASIGDVAAIGKGAAKGAAIGGFFGGQVGMLAGAILGGINAAGDIGLDPDLEQQMAEQAIGGKPDSGPGGENPGPGTGGPAADSPAGGAQAAAGHAPGTGETFRHGGLVSEASEPGFRQPTQATVHEGEFVMRPEAVEAIGPANLAAANMAGPGSPGMPQIAATLERQAMQNLAPEEFAELQSLITPRLLDLVSRAFGPASGVTLASISGSEPAAAPGPGSPGALGVTNDAGPLSRGAAPFRPQNQPPATPLRRLGGPVG